MSKIYYVYYGGYPSSLVTSDSTVKNLSKTSFDNRSVGEYGGSKYMKIDYMQSSTQTATLYYRFAPIKWKVIFSSKNELTLISDQVIDFYEYNGMTSWLSNSFTSTAFSSTERKILSDDVTLLSVGEIDNYSKLNKKTTVTDYATMRKNFGKNKYDTYAVAMWWIKGSGSASYIDGSGTVATAGETSQRQGIRPIIKIKVQ